MEQKAEMNAKMGNWTCILRELRMVDKNIELDLESMLDNVKDMNIRDSWLLDRTVEDTRTCFAVSLCYILDSFIGLRHLEISVRPITKSVLADI